MRFERTIAVLVLATGVVCVGVADSTGQTGQTGQATPEATATNPTARPAPTLPVNSWKQTEPRPEHAVLTGLVGHFKTSVRVFAGQYVRQKDTESTADAKLLLGGLFVQVTHAEKRMKEPFERMMLYGYDVASRKYTVDSIDTTSTAMIHYFGTYDAEKKQLNLSSRYSDQTSRKLTTARSVTTFVDAKTWTYDEFISHGVGEAETQTVSIRFTRE